MKKILFAIIGFIGFATIVFANSSPYLVQAIIKDKAAINAEFLQYNVVYQRFLATNTQFGIDKNALLVAENEDATLDNCEIQNQSCTQGNNTCCSGVCQGSGCY